jgi:RNA polymerase-associated protein CTR9
VYYGAVRLSTNLATLNVIQGEVETAEGMFQESIQRMGPENGKEADMLKTVIAYDLGRANEKSGDSIKATQWYRDVLRQHPEHMECELWPMCRTNSQPRFALPPSRVP